MVLLVVTIATMTATAIWFERAEAVDQPVEPIEWGAGGEGPSSPPPDDMILVPGGTYWIGDDSPEPGEESPPTRVVVDTFYIDRHEVMTRQFSEFVAATGHVTTAEKVGGSWIYRAGEADWTWVRGANWKTPLGLGSSVKNAMDHPVVLVSWFDAVAYADWAEKRLPTEVEWEVAARGGTPAVFEGRHFRGGITKQRHEKHRGAPHGLVAGSFTSAEGGSNPAEDGSANVWQGRWPRKNLMTDAFFYTAPAGSFEPNGLGIYDMIGNVWEWTADWYTPSGNATAGTRRVARGGSWFCSSNYCAAYRPGFRGKSPPSSSFNNVGFRCAKDS